MIKLLINEKILYYVTWRNGAQLFYTVAIQSLTNMTLVYVYCMKNECHAPPTAILVFENAFWSVFKLVYGTRIVQLRTYNPLPT